MDRRAASTEEGFSLIELLVAISILSVVLTGLAYGLITAMAVTADSRIRTIAANLASQEIDLAGATPITDLEAETVTHVEEVQGIRFTVTRDAQWETTSAEAAACTALANSAVGQGRRFLQVNVAVDWERRRSGQPVRASTAITPAVASYRAGFGHVAITVVDRDGAPQPGVVVRLEGTTNRTVTTTSIGCAFFSDVPPGDDYVVRVEMPGYLDADVASPGVEEPVVVEDGVTAKRDFVFDLGAGLDMTVGGRWGGAVPNGLVVTAEAGTAVTRTSAVGDGTTRRTIGATQADGGVTRDVFPYTGGWTTWAGCAHNRPDSPEYAESGETREVDPVILAPEPGEVAAGTVVAGTLQVRAEALRSERGGQPLYARDLDAPVGTPCATPLYLGDFGPLGTFVGDVALPVGDNWQLAYGTGAGTPLDGGAVVVTPYRAAEYHDIVALASYRDTILSSGPFLYYRLGDALGSTALDSSGALRHGTYMRGAVINRPGISGNAAAFDGSSQAYVAPGPTTLTSPNTFSVEVWFRTAAGYGEGGRLIGFGSARTGTSASYDRHLYMRNDGQLVWGVYPGTVRTVVTNRASGGYNDGLWHHAVATLGPAGMALYVDGVLAASRTDTTTGESYIGYVRVGRDNLTYWPDSPASYGIEADVDEAAAYTVQLSASRVAAHHAAGGTAGYADEVLADAPFVYHRFEEPGAVDASGNDRHGSYTGSVTVGRPGALAGDTDTAVGIGARNQMVNAGDLFDRTGRAPFTVELWARPTVVDADYRPLVMKEVASGARQGWTLTHQNQYGLVFERWRDNVLEGTSTGVALTPDTWYHIVATYDGTTGRIYVDGTLRASATMALDLVDTTDPVRIGGWPYDYVAFAGDLDELALYERALSAAEVDAHYRSGQP